MRFSVVVCTHNRAEVLPRALQAIAQMDVPADWGWELIVVDNASTDRTAEVVHDFAARAPMPVRYVYEARLGHSAALNTGVRACRGEFIAFTDDDALPHSDWLVRLDEAFRTHDVQCAFGKAIPHWDQPTPRWFSPRFNKYFALIDYGPKPFVLADGTTPFYGVNHAWHRDALQSLGGYREDLGLYGNRGGVGNDLDLLERALAAGMRVAYTPDACVGHIIPRERCGKAHQRRKVWVGTEYHYEFLRDNPPDVPWLLGLPRYFFRFAASDLGAYLRAIVRRNRPDAFYHELQLIRFAGFLRAAGRAGFRRKARPASAQPNGVSA